MALTVAIIGRPNVGKSTLFNRLIGKQQAIVADTPGVTRDRREGQAELGPYQFTVIDTAGLEKSVANSIEERMMSQTEKALSYTHVALLVIDGRAGVTSEDRHFANWLRKKDIHTILVVNKCETEKVAQNATEAYSLGFSSIVFLSSAHGIGFSDLLDELIPFLAEHDTSNANEADDEEEDAIDDFIEIDDEAVDDSIPEGDEIKPVKDPYLQVAIVGRPNAGKSTLVNQLLNEDRVITGPEAGLTRDAIAIHWEFQGKPIRLYDTAGMRKKAKITADLEKSSIHDALDAVRFAHVVVLLLDALAPLEQQDIAIANHIMKEGRAVVIAVNKWDLVDHPDLWLPAVRDKVQKILPAIRGVSIVPISALHGNNKHKLMKSVLNAYALWNSRIATTKLNQWLTQAQEQHPAPLGRNKRPIRLKYASQLKTRPPTIAIYGNKPKELPDSYTRYLMHSLRETFKLPGVPLRLYFRKSDNPYDK